MASVNNVIFISINQPHGRTASLGTAAPLPQIPEQEEINDVGIQVYFKSGFFVVFSPLFSQQTISSVV